MSRPVVVLILALFFHWLWAWRLSRHPPERLQVFICCISCASSIGQRLLSEREDFQGMEAEPTQTWDWGGFSTGASPHFCQRLPVAFGVGDLCSTRSLSLGVRLCVFGEWWWRELFSVNTIADVESSSQSVVVNKHMCPRLFSNIWTSLYFMIAQLCSISSNID
jgi:hypothetical protein